MEQHSTWNGLALNHPIWRLHSKVSSHQRDSQQDNQATSLTLPLPSKSIHYFIFILLMVAHHNLRSCSPLKTVLGRIGDNYQAYCNTYKTHTMATHHGGSGQPLDRVTNMTREEQPVVDTNLKFCRTSSLRTEIVLKT